MSVSRAPTTARGPALTQSAASSVGVRAASSWGPTEYRVPTSMSVPMAGEDVTTSAPTLSGPSPVAATKDSTCRQTEPHASVST